jgi:WD40 repeat protein
VCAFSDRLQLFAVRVSVAAEGEPPCALTPKDPPSGAASLTGMGETKCICFSPDGSIMALGGGDGRLRLFAWPALTLRADVKDAHTDAISDADFSPDGSLLLTTGNEKVGPAGGAAVWRVEEKALSRVRWLEGVRGRKGARVTLRGAKFARDGSGMAYTGANTDGTARVLAWRVADWRCMKSCHALPEPLTSLALSPGVGRLLAAGGAEGSLVMLSAKTLATLRRVPGAHMVFVTGLSFSPSGRTVASLSGDASARCTLAPPRRSIGYVIMRLLLTLIVHFAIVSLVVHAHRQGHLRRPSWLS